MTDYPIKTFKAEGAALLSALHAQCFDAPWGEAEMVRLLGSTGVLGLVAHHDGTPCGMAMIRTIAGESELLTIGVPPASRRLGVAGCLLRACGKHAAASGASRLILEVSEHNKAALNLYENQGFKQIGTRARYYRDGSTAHVLSKPI